ncbi:MAG: hypothetical protein VR73_02465 [Gammaproteobacteria bacterium BRH_c0]|nr:MAG: hypothetical protein VR73_02465 [Gammaproteobacteria bacterium BRH_c0]
MWKPMKMAVLALGLSASPLLCANPWMDKLTLPLPGQLPCCASQEQQLLIAADGTAINGSATVTIDDDGLNVEVRDHQNLQLATLHHSPAGEITVSDSSLWKPALTRLVLTAMYLHRLDPRQWAATQPGWSWQSGDGETQLLYQGESQIKLDYGKPSEPGAATQFSMAASGFALTLKVLGATPGGN